MRSRPKRGPAGGPSADCGSAGEVTAPEAASTTSSVAITAGDAGESEALDSESEITPRTLGCAATEHLPSESADPGEWMLSGQARVMTAVSRPCTRCDETAPRQLPNDVLWKGMPLSSPKSVHVT